MGKGAFRELDDGVVHDEVDDGQDGEQEEGYWAGKHGGTSEGVRARDAGLWTYEGLRLSRRCAPKQRWPVTHVRAWAAPLRRWRREEGASDIKKPSSSRGKYLRGSCFRAWNADSPRRPRRWGRGSDGNSKHDWPRIAAIAGCRRGPATLRWRATACSRGVGKLSGRLAISDARPPLWLASSEYGGAGARARGSSQISEALSKRRLRRSASIIAPAQLEVPGTPHTGVEARRTA